MKKRNYLITILLILIFILCTGNVFTATAAADEDFITKVKGESETLVMRKYGSNKPAIMVVWIHGDVSQGGPADYHFMVAEIAASKFQSDNIMSVAIVRPGYSDNEGNTSTGNNYNRIDSYTKENINEVGTAIERLRSHYNPKKVIIVGHSGGAAYTAVLLGMKPNLADAVILVSCPCDLVAWRAGRHGHPWTMSENPIQWINKVRNTTKVIALTGSNDDNTPPELAKSYVKALKEHGVDAKFILLPGETHNSAFKSNEVLESLKTLIE